MDRHEIESHLIAKASADPAFRRRLLDDPKAAVADLLGVALPPGMTITVLEEQPGQHYLILPPAPPDLDALPLDDLAGPGRPRSHTAAVCGELLYNKYSPRSKYDTKFLLRMA